jgi:hypothetical protein
MNGFEKRFHFWDDDWRHDEGSPLPLQNSVTYSREMEEGQALIHGVYRDSDYRLPYDNVRSPSTPRPISEFTFKCDKETGAVLVATSSADIEQLRDPTILGLKDSLITHAERIYRAAHGDFESLVIVTGCIKSHSWAIASYQEKASSELGQILRLEECSPNPADPDNLPSFVWTRQAMAEVRCGSNRKKPGSVNRCKDQALFLRGFNMTFSTDFRERMKGKARRPSSSGGSNDNEFERNDGHPGSTSDRWQGNSPSRFSGKRGGRGGTQSNERVRGCGGAPVDGVDVKPLPGSRESVGYHLFSLGRLTLIFSPCSTRLIHGMFSTSTF